MSRSRLLGIGADRPPAHERAREDFRRALQEAHEAGATYEQLGKLVGLSRQRIGVLIRD